MMMMIIIIIVNIIPSISYDVTGIRGNIYIHSTGMKMNACSLILLCQISDKNERKIVDISSRVLMDLGADHILLVCWVRVATRIELHVWTHIINNQTYIPSDT